ncbi:MAG TPA: sugar ABC transporter permease, partial [Erwinia persicina]|nr:sugar ABC transporter permease [Erwinia persicina]
MISPSEKLMLNKRTRQHALTGALLALLPGFGQFYHRQWAKGICFLILLTSFYGVFHNFLQQGLWGLATLGEQVPRDNSIFLLAEGIISVLIIAFGITIWGLSLRDAWLNGCRRDEGKPLHGVRKQYQLLLREGFPYLMI